MRKPHGVLAAVLVTAGCASAPLVAPGLPAPAAMRAPVPTADELRQDLMVFASDSFRGRETGTPDERRAAAFLVTRLTALGLDPAGDSGYYQRVPLQRAMLGPSTRFTVSGANVTDLTPILATGDNAPPPKANAEGDLVFAGYGLQRQGTDDFDRVSVKGRVVVVVNGAPPGASSEARAALEAESAISTRLQRLIPRHPAAVIVLLTGPSAGLSARLRSELGRSLEPAGPSRAVVPDEERPIPMILIGTASSRTPLLPDHWMDGTPRLLRHRHFTGHVESLQQRVTSYNVVAIVPGHDPQLKDTYVAFGAHYDHIGIQPAEHGDSIANGADDDGSGSVALLALARAFRREPPRRSVLFVWHVGEEKGLLGSGYFTAHPTVPLDSIVAQINADMIGRNAPESLYVVGPNAAPHDQSRVLGQVLDSVNAHLAHPFAFDREWDSPTHPEQIYYRSDHYNYARKGVPIVFLTTGLHADYHRVTDEPAKIDFDKLAHVDLLMFDLGMALANRDTRPR